MTVKGVRKRERRTEVRTEYVGPLPPDGRVG